MMPSPLNNVADQKSLSWFGDNKNGIITTIIVVFYLLSLCSILFIFFLLSFHKN